MRLAGFATKQRDCPASAAFDNRLRDRGGDTYADSRLPLNVDPLPPKTSEHCDKNGWRVAYRFVALVAPMRNCSDRKSVRA